MAILSRGYGSERGRTTRRWCWKRTCPTCRTCKTRTASPWHAGGRGAGERSAGARRWLPAPPAASRSGRGPDRCDAGRRTRDYLFPRGTLREPACWPAAGRRDPADALRSGPRPRNWTTRDQWLARRFPGKPVAGRNTGRSSYRAERNRSRSHSLRAEWSGAFCGIGNPEAFRRDARGLGAGWSTFRPSRTITPTPAPTWTSLWTWANRLPADALIVTTQKDWVKLRLPELAGRPLRAVRIGLAFPRGAE